MLRSALIVGINRYSYINPLQVANGAEELARKLAAQGQFTITRYPEKNMEIDPECNVIAQNLQDKISELFIPDSKQIPDLALFYFVGHGQRISQGTNKEGYLLTSAANWDIKPMNEQGIAFSWLKSVLAASKVKRQIVWLDCCFSGEFLNYTEDDLFNNDPDKIRFFITSSQDFKVSYTQGQSAIFTDLLLQGIDEITNREKVVTSKNLANFIQNHVSRFPQKPMIYCDPRPLYLAATKECQNLLHKSTPTKVEIKDLDAVAIWEGQDQMLANLTSKLLPEESNKVKVIAIIGQGGIGKSSVAVKLLENLGVNLSSQNADVCFYDYVIGCRVGQNTSFDEIANWLGKILELPLAGLQKSSDKLQAILKGLQEKICLLILDNLEDILQPESHTAISEDWCEFINALVYQPHRSRIVLTSRGMPRDLKEKRGLYLDPIRVHREDVVQVSSTASVKILQAAGVPYPIQDLEWIAQQVDGHVFVLNQLASYIKEGEVSIRELRVQPELLTNNANNILRVQLERQTLGNKDLLKRMCVLRDAIDIKGLTFLRLYSNDDFRFEMAAMLSEPAELTNAEIQETKDMIKRLVDSSLVRKRKDEKKDELVYDLHQVIRDFLQQEYQKELPQLLESVYKFYSSGKSVENPQTLADLHPVLEAQHFAFQLGNYDEALSLLQSISHEYLYVWGHWTLLKDLYEQLLPYVDKDDKPYCLQSIGVVHRDSGNWEEAEKYFKDALEISQELNAKSGMATSWGLLGNIERNRGNWDEAERLYRDSLEMRTELGDRSGMASSWGVLGDIERNRGNWDEAERLFRQSLAIYTELGDRSGMASSWGQLGYIESVRGNWDEAERLYRQSLAMMTELGDRSGMASSWGVLGDIESVRGNWDEAERLYRQSLAMRTELGDRSGMASSWASLGDIERNRGNWDEAERLYRQCLAMRTELGDRSGMALSIGSLGENELGKGNLDAAEKLLKEALDTIQELGMTRFIAVIYYNLARLARERGNDTESSKYYETAYETFKRLGAMKDMEKMERWEWL